MNITLAEVLALLSRLTLGLVVNVIFYAIEHWND